MKTSILFKLTTFFGFLSLLAFVFERMALTDIFHGEPNLKLEWTVVNAALIPLFIFHVLGIATAISGWRHLNHCRKLEMQPGKRL